MWLLSLLLTHDREASTVSKFLSSLEVEELGAFKDWGCSEGLTVGLSVEEEASA